MLVTSGNITNMDMALKHLKEMLLICKLLAMNTISIANISIGQKKSQF